MIQGYKHSIWDKILMKFQVLVLQVIVQKNKNKQQNKSNHQQIYGNVQIVKLKTYLTKMI